MLCRLALALLSLLLQQHCNYDAFPIDNDDNADTDKGKTNNNNNSISSSEVLMRLSDTPSIAPSTNASLSQIKTDSSSINAQNSAVSQPSTVNSSTTDAVYGRLMTIVPKISAFLSMIGSAMVTTYVAKSQ